MLLGGAVSSSRSKSARVISVVFGQAQIFRSQLSTIVRCTFVRPLLFIAWSPSRGRTFFRGSVVEFMGEV